MLSLENLSNCIVVTCAGFITDYMPRQERQCLYMELVAEYVLKIIKLFLADRRGTLHTVTYLYQVHLDCRVLSCIVLFSKTYFVGVMRH